MSRVTDADRGDDTPFPAGRLLIGAAVILLFAAGLLLWAHRGAAVFTDLMSAAIAWCF